MIHEVAFDAVKKYLDTTLIFRNITFLVRQGDKVGLIGANGCGKTTILKLIAGILKLNHCAGYPYAPVPPGYDEGWVKISKYTRCAYLEQIPQYDEALRVLDVLNLNFSDVHQLEEKMRAMERDMAQLKGDSLNKALAAYSDLVQLYEFKGGYETEEKLSKICTGLKFNENFLEQNFQSLSGGEKTTVILGKLLMDAPDVLLLDEPTNHLDMESVEWLQSYIRQYKVMVIVVSHDRYFLDQSVTKIIEVENKECQTYHGNYSDYLKQKEENLSIQADQYKEQKKKIDKMEQSIKRLRAWADQSDNNKFYKRAASMQIQLNKMNKVQKPLSAAKGMRMSIITGERSGNVVIHVERLSKGFGERVLFKKADLLIQYGERVALIGPNGCGKTTFLKMLFNETQPDEGSLSLGAHIHMAYLPQQLDFEDEELTLLEYFREDLTIPEGKAREHLAKFLFYGGNVFKKIKLLSGGERVRLKLSKLLYGNVNLLILDEPTNHLDIASIESIETALLSFQGTILFISHDRYFINKTCDRIIAVEEYAFKSYLGNYDYYKEVKAAEALMYEQQKSSSAPLSDKTVKHSGEMPDNNNVKGSIDVQLDCNAIQTDNISRNSHARHANNTQRISMKSQKEQEKLENNIQTRESQLSRIELDMQSCESDFEALNTLFKERERLQAELQDLYEAWDDLIDLQE